MFYGCVYQFVGLEVNISSIAKLIHKDLQKSRVKMKKKAWKTWLAFIPKVSKSYYFDSCGRIVGAWIKELWIVSESVVQRCSAKTWKFLQKSQEKHVSWSLLFRFAALSKRDSDTRLFLWILWIFFFRDHL